jgi:hypothetical protein
MASDLSSEITSHDGLSPRAELAAYGGMIPLAILPIAMVLLPGYAQRQLAQQIAVAYGAVVLAGAGGVHWGLALAGRLSWRAERIAGAILPAICGAAAVILGGQRGLALLAIAFGLFWLYEHRSVGAELPPDYLRLRRNLSLAGCCLLAFTMILSDYVGLL